MRGILRYIGVVAALQIVSSLWFAAVGFFVSYDPYYGAARGLIFLPLYFGTARYVTSMLYISIGVYLVMRWCEARRLEP